MWIKATTSLKLKDIFIDKLGHKMTALIMKTVNFFVFEFFVNRVLSHLQLLPYFLSSFFLFIYSVKFLILILFKSLFLPYS